MADIQSLTVQVLAATFLLSFLFGAISQKTHFCTMGAISDVVAMGDYTRLRQWALAAGVAMLGFGAMAYVGAIEPSKTLYVSNRWMWMSAAIGGAMFGFGMVLGSGCGSKTLVRIGGGNLKSLVVFLALGVAAFATLKGITAVVRVATVDRVGWQFDVPATLSAAAARAFEADASLTGLVLALLFGGGLILWALWGAGFVRAQNLLAGLGVGAIITAMWWVSGYLGHVAEHPDTLQEVFLATNSGRAEALSFVSPVAYTLDWLMFFSDRSKLVTVGIISVFGVVAGSAAIALYTRSFRWEGFAGPGDVASHLAGATLMGIGGVTAMGCTIGQGLSGLATLSATSIVAVAAIGMGAVAALKYQVWRLGG